MNQTQNGYEAVMHRATADESFLMRLRNEPEDALEPYDIDEEMEQAIIDGDEPGLHDAIGKLQTATVFTVTVVLVTDND